MSSAAERSTTFFLSSLHSSRQTVSLQFLLFAFNLLVSNQENFEDLKVSL